MSFAGDDAVGKGGGEFLSRTGLRSTGRRRGHLQQGWLTQYLPEAIVDSPGFSRDRVDGIDFNRSTLEWRDVILHRSSDDPLADPQSSQDDEALRPARIELNGESADSIVYRGVANQPAPLRVVRAGPELVITSAGAAQIDVSQLWLLEIGAKGRNSVRRLRPFNQETAFLVKTPAEFIAEESSPECIDALRSDLKAAVRRAGLFEREADALIETFSSAPLQRVGLRLLFISPAKSNKAYLSMRVRARGGSGRWKDVESTRAQVGCIEIVTPEQRALLARIAAGDEEQSVTGALPTPEMLSEDRWQELREIYGWLGQFGNALILDEQRRRPAPILQAFIERFHLEGYVPKSPFERLRAKPIP